MVKEFFINTKKTVHKEVCGLEFYALKGRDGSEEVVNDGHISLEKKTGEILEIWKAKREVKEKKKERWTKEELLYISNLGWKEVFESGIELKTALEKIHQLNHYLRSILTLRISSLENEINR